MIKIKRLIKSFRYAFKGLCRTIKEEQNLKMQLIVAFVVILLGFYFKISKIDWLFLILIITIVLLMEIGNSAVERVTDMLKPRINNYVKEIKDISAAAVMLASVMAVIAGLIIFWPYFFNC